MPEALREAMAKKYDQLTEQGHERSAAIMFSRMTPDDLTQLFKFAPFDAFKSVDELVEKTSQDIAQLLEEEAFEAPQPDLLTHLHLVIKDNIRRNLGFIRHNLNLYEGFRDDRVLTLDELMETKDKIFARHLQRFLQSIRRLGNRSLRLGPLHFQEYDPLLSPYRDILVPRLLPGLRMGKIRTMTDLQFALQQFGEAQLSPEAKYALRQRFNDMLIDVNQDLLRAIDIIPRRVGMSAEEALHIWTKRRNETVHKIDNVGPFLNSLINRLWLDEDPDRPNQLTTDMRPPNELRQALLSELLDDMDVDRVLRRMPRLTDDSGIAAAKKEANRHAHLAQLIALKTGHSLSITYSEVLKKVSNLLRMVDIQSVAPKNNKLLYVLWNTAKQRFELFAHPNKNDVRHVQVRTNGHNAGEILTAEDLAETLDGDMEEDDLERSLQRAKHTPYMMNLRTWVDGQGNVSPTHNGEPFLVHFRDISEKREDPIEAKLRGDVSHIEEIFDLARMNFWVLHPLEEILANPGIHEDILRFATDLGVRSAGLHLRSYNKKEDRYILAPGEFMILSNLTKQSSSKSAVNTFKDVRLYCKSHDGVGFEIQIVPIDIALKEMNAEDFMNHGWLEIQRQLRVILEEASYMYDPEIHALVPRIQARIRYLSTLEEAPKHPLHTPLSRLQSES